MTDVASPAPAPSDAPFNRLKDCRYGRMLYNVNDLYVGRSLDLYGEFSEGEVEVFRQLVRPGDLVMDVGANVGAHTVWFAKVVGPGGVVLAFEPQRLVFQTLCANVALNSLTNVWTFQLALGESAGMARAPAPDPRRPTNFGGLSVRTDPQSRGEPVSLARGDALPISRCRLVKVDVEGMELAVLKGLSGVIDRHKPALYVENDRAEQSAALVRYVDSIGYDAYWHPTPLFNPNNFFGNAENVFGTVVSGNMLCMPRSAAAQLSGFQRVEVPKGAEGQKAPPEVPNAPDVPKGAEPSTPTDVGQQERPVP